MKIIVPVSLVLILLAIVLPIFLLSPGNNANAIESPTEAAVAGDLVSDTSAETLDKSLTVRLLDDDSIQEMSMYDYLIGVVSAEMPVTFEDEALKAQTVTARTYTLYKMCVSPNTTHPDADVCSDYNCCAAYSSPEALQERWGDAYEDNYNRIAACVRATDGLYIDYDGQPILAVFHSSSSGATEASVSVWGGELPYLQSVRSFEEGTDIPNFYTSVELTYDEFAADVLAAYPDAALDAGDTGGWITDVVRSDAGRIISITVGGVTMKGSAFRTLFSLRSANIEIAGGEAGFTLSTQGFGHGVGMSQYGADFLAAMGLDAAHILTWYYTDVTLQTMDTLF